MQSLIKYKLEKIKKKNILVQKKDLFELTNSKNTLGIIRFFFNMQLYETCL